MLGVVAREGPDAVGAQELVLVEHLRQHAAELGLVQDGGQPPARMTGLARVVDEGRQLGARPRNLWKRSRSSGYFAMSFPSKTVTAHRGSRPTMERTFRRWARPSGSRSTS